MRQLPLADEFYLISHDEYTGKCHINAKVFDSGLAGAVLAELAVRQRITIVNGLVTTIDQRPHRERVSDAALAEILKERAEHPVRTWVEYLRKDALEMVRPRLVDAGLIYRVQSRSMLRSTVRYPAVDRNQAAAPRARLRYMLDHPELLDEPTAVLSGLVLAVGMTDLIAVRGKEAREGLGRFADTLPDVLKEIVTAVELVAATIAVAPKL
ncbi:GOLPH3/VPS74 family protein [Luedemannella helvata]|uniref:Golgi phosphoprotein 3 n=1 Tax=Luedemannella helvata TaxID=349315 RepID=A0ABN2K6R2_9ACTN